MRRAGPALAALSVLALLLAGCERPQTLTATARKADTQPWEASGNRWAPKEATGDKAAWERQMALRAQSQNEYLRSERH